MNKLLEVNGVVKKFTSAGEVLNILKGVNLSLGYGEKVAITGESGSGKSTLMHIMGGLDHLDEGSIIIEGTDITKLDETALSGFRNKKIGFIFQSHYLLEEFSAVENVMIPYLMDNFDKKQAKDRAQWLLEVVGLKDRMSHHPSKMSGGERQRVAIARALINEPAIILADEPTGNLDESNAERVMQLLFELTAKEASCGGKHTLVLVTHSPTIAKLCDVNYKLTAGELLAI